VVGLKAKLRKEKCIICGKPIVDETPEWVFDFEKGKTVGLAHHLCAEKLRKQRPILDEYF
jgi:hypothetical protein